MLQLQPSCELVVRVRLVGTAVLVHGLHDAAWAFRHIAEELEAVVEEGHAGSHLVVASDVQPVLGDGARLQQDLMEAGAT